MLSKRLHEIEFPVFMMRKYNSIEQSNNLIRVLTHHDEYILDSLLLKEQEPDYSVRRLILSSQGHNMYPLNKKIDTIAQLLRVKSGVDLIDNSGYRFKMQRSKKFYTVVSREIKKMVYKPGHGTVVHVRDLPYPLFCKHKVSSLYRFASCLDYKGGAVLFGFTKTKEPNKRVKI